MSRNLRPPQLIVPVEEHFTGRITWRDSWYFPKIKAKFIQCGLLDRVKESPFKQFFMAEPLNFSGALVHQLLLHKFRGEKIDEVQFYIGKKRCRFSQLEFALVTGLNFEAGPSEAEIKAKTTSDRLILEYFNGHSPVSIGQLRRTFESCQIVDDVYKMGLCLLVEGVLKGREEKLMVWTDMPKMVDDVDFFFQYPWGKISYQKLLQTCQKDFVEMKKHLQKKIEKEKTQKEAKYSIYGYSTALQYWAFESIIELGQDYAARLGQGIPRMIKWQSKKRVEIHKEQLIKLPDDVDDHIFRTPEDMQITVIGDTEDSEWDASGYDGVYYRSFCHKVTMMAWWDAFPGSDYSSFSWDDSILDLVRGDAVQFLPSWQNKEFIYFALFLKDQLHWVAVEADLNGWMLNIFHSSIGSISENDLISLMVDWCTIFPSVLRQSGLFENHDVILAPQLTASESQVRPFDWKLTPREFEPQTKSR
ncbi:uncharacterized protein LOC133796015 [Humulus lupulus]|uniref:uncharacterized protein LOC133796015 n=1 Tax=Humulus lupulus TaxID=3486 RepID=UPI002B416ECC|nr:uncharacterized protein LOC133796015 [Humulus lupulus]